MFILQLTPQEKNNLLVFLNRVDLKGTEAAFLATLQNKIQNAATIKTTSEEPSTEGVSG